MAPNPSHRFNVRKGNPISTDYDMVRTHTGCPTCNARPGEECRTLVSGMKMRLIHGGRTAQYQRRLRNMHAVRDRLRAG